MLSLTKAVLKREFHPSREQEQAEPAPLQPKPEPVDGKPMDPGRPHQAFVESRLRRFMQDENIHSLVKPGQEEIRAAAMPILCRALRNRPGNRRHQAVIGMAQHALERGWVKPPYSNPNESPSWLDALIQLADDANWLAREIPLPPHSKPHHPPVYYTVDPVTNKPCPRLDSLILANYVYEPAGSRIASGVICPWIHTGFFPTGFFNWRAGACYTLDFGPKNDPRITIHWLVTRRGYKIGYSYHLDALYFSPHPPYSYRPGQVRRGS